MWRAGLIGFGLAGSAFHAPLIGIEKRLTLGGVASSRADAVRARWPDARVHADPAALIADPEIDLVVIATPNATHAPLAEAALRAGKHVVIDKPFVTDPADGAALIALAAERGRVLTVFHNRRWDGDFLTVRKLLRERRLGEIALATLSWDRFRPALKSGWREEEAEGAGLLADLGPHLVDQALQLFGPPAFVAGDLAVQRTAARVDDYFEITLRYGSTRVVLSASTLVAEPRPRFSLHGDRGSYVKYGLDAQEADLRSEGAPDAAGYGHEPPSAWGVLVTDGGREPVPTERGDWPRFYAGVVDAMAGTAPPPVDPAEALAGIELMALARRSAREGRTLPFPAGSD